MEPEDKIKFCLEGRRRVGRMKCAGTITPWLSGARAGPGTEYDLQARNRKWNRSLRWEPMMRIATTPCQGAERRLWDTIHCSHFPPLHTLSISSVAPTPSAHAGSTPYFLNPSVHWVDLANVVGLSTWNSRSGLILGGAGNADLGEASQFTYSVHRPEN